MNRPICEAHCVACRRTSPLRAVWQTVLEARPSRAARALGSTGVPHSHQSTPSLQDHHTLPGNLCLRKGMRLAVKVSAYGGNSKPLKDLKVCCDHLPCVHASGTGVPRLQDSAPSYRNTSQTLANTLAQGAVGWRVLI